MPLTPAEAIDAARKGDRAALGLVREEPTVPVAAPAEEQPIGPPEPPRVTPAEAVAGARARAGQERDLDAGFQAWKATQTSLTPERGIDVAMVARATGKPFDFVADHLDELKKGVDQERLKKGILESPTLQRLMQDPQSAAVVKDRLDDFSTWEWIFGRWTRTPTKRWDPLANGYAYELKGPETMADAPAWVQAARGGWAESVQVPALAAKVLGGQGTPEDEAELERLDKEYGGRTYGAHNPATRALVGAPKMLPYIVGSALARLAGGAAAGLAGGGAGAAAGAPAAGVGAVPGAAVGGISAAAVGQYVAGAAFDFFENVGPLYLQLRRMKNADGDPLLSDEEAKGYAVSTSAGLSLLTSGIGAKVATSVPWLKDVLKKQAERGAQAAFVHAGGAEALKYATIQYGKHVASGAALMATQAAGNAATVELSRAQHGEAADWWNVGRAARDGAVTGLQDMLLIAGWTPAREYLREVGLTAQIQAEGLRYDALIEQAGKSKILEHPETGDHVLDQVALAQGSPVMLADPAGWDAYWTGRKFNPREVAGEVAGDSGAQYDRAKAGLDTDLSFPLQKWASKFKGTEHLLGLRDDVKFTGETRTRRQQAAWAKQLEGLRKVAEGVGKDEQVGELDGIEHAKYLEVLAAKPELGEAHAQAVARLFRDSIAFFASKAQLTPAQVAQQFPLPIHGEGPAGPRVATPAPEGVPVPEVQARPQGPATPPVGPVEAPGPRRPAEWPAGRGKDLPAETRALILAAYRGDRRAILQLKRAAFVDALVPQVGNQRAHEEFLRSKGSEGGVHVVLDMPGLKARNDLYGQIAGDQALQVFGRELAEASRPQRGKAHRMSTGDEFYGHFDTAAQADAFLEDFKGRLAGPAGKLREKDQLSLYAGVGATKEAAVAELVKAKGAAKAKYGDSRAGGALGHGESFVSRDELAVVAPPSAVSPAPAKDVGKAAERAFSFLRSGKGGAELADLVRAAKEASAAGGKGEVPKELRKQVDAVQKEIRDLEAKRAKAAGKAEPGDKDEQVRRQIEAQDPVMRRSTTRRVHLVLAPDEEGGAPRWQVLGPEAPPAGAEIRPVTMPEWLSGERFAGERPAWEWTWSALQDGSAAPEQAQKLVQAYMRRAFEDFPPNDFALRQGYAVARILDGFGGKKLKSVFDDLRAWMRLPEGARPEDPLPEVAWGHLIDFAQRDIRYVTTQKGFANKQVTSTMLEWLRITRAELDPSRPTFAKRPPKFYGQAVTLEEARAPTAADPIAAKLEGLRARAGELEAQAREARVQTAAARPKLDAQAVIDVVGADAQGAFRGLIAEGGIHPDELAKRLGLEDGVELLSAMAAAHREKTGDVGVVELDQGAVVLRQGEVSEASGSPWHSAVERAIESVLLKVNTTPLKDDEATPREWLAKIRKTPGVKAEEIEILGLDALLGGADQTKRARWAIVAAVRQRRIVVTERILGEPPKLDAMGQAIRRAMVEELHAEGLEYAPAGDGAGPGFRLADERFGIVTLSQARDIMTRRSRGDRGGVFAPIPDSQLEAIVNAGANLVALEKDGGDGILWYLTDGAPVPAHGSLISTAAWIAQELSHRELEGRVTKDMLEPVRKTLQEQLDASLEETGAKVMQVWEMGADSFTFSPPGFQVIAGALAGAGRGVGPRFATRAEAEAHALVMQKAYRELKRPEYESAVRTYQGHLDNLAFFEGKHLEEYASPEEKLKVHYGGPQGYTVGNEAEGTYREILLFRPEQPTGVNELLRQGFYQSPHFQGDAGLNGDLMAHARVSEHRLGDDSRVLLIEEIQSDLHQAGREKGYTDAQVDPARFKVDSGKTTPSGVTLWRVEDPVTRRVETLRSDFQRNVVDEASARAHFASLLVRELRQVQASKKAVPDTPFKETWEELVVKRVLRYAAEKGHNRIALTPGEVHTRRWGSELIAWEKGPKTESAPELVVSWEDARGKLMRAIQDHSDTVQPRNERFWSGRLAELSEAKTEQEAADAIGRGGESFAEAIHRLERAELNGFGLGDLLGTHEVQGFHLRVKEQSGGQVAGLNLEEAAVARGLVHQGGAPDFVASEADLEAKLTASLPRWSAERRAAVAKKLWAKMQTQDQGASAPRAEAFTQAYDRRIKGVLEKLAKKYRGKLEVAPLGDVFKGSARWEIFRMNPGELRNALASKISVRLEQLWQAEKDRYAALTLEEQRRPDTKLMSDAERETERSLHSTISNLSGGSDILHAIGIPDRDPVGTYNAMREWSDRVGIPIDDLVNDPHIEVWTVDLPQEGRNRILREGLPLFQEGRGLVKFRVPGSPGEGIELDLTLLARADESTAAHELGHWMGLVLGQLASRVGAAPELQGLYATALKAMGYTDHDQRIAALLELQALARREAEGATLTAAEKTRRTTLEAGEEQLSHAFELYLSEGKAPTVELGRIFSRFKLWMVRIYKGLAGVQATYEKDYGRPLELSDDVRRMFDRILGADEAVRQAELDLEGAQLEAAVRAAAPPAEADQIVRDLLEARRLGKEQVHRLLLAEDSRERQEFFQREREKASTEIAAELDKQPGYRAQRFLREGVMPEGQALPDELVTDVGEPRMLDRDEAVARYGADFVNRALRGLTTRGDRAVPADVAAEAFEFKSGDELVQALAKLPNRAETIRTRVEERLQRDFGPTLLENPAKLADEAMDGIHNEAKARSILAGMRLLARKLYPALDPRFRSVDLVALERRARELVDERPLTEAAPGRALQAEKRQGRLALELLGKAVREKDETTRREIAAQAFDAHEQALFSHFMWRAAKEARDQADKDVARLRTVSGPRIRADLGKAGADYQERVDDLLASVELRASRSVAEVGRRRDINAAAGGDTVAAASMLAWIEQQRALNRDPYVPDRVIELLKKTQHWRELTPAELADLRSTVDSIVHLAHVKTTLLTTQGRRERKAIIGELSQRLFESFGDNAIVVDRNTLSFKKRALRAVKRLQAGVIRPEEFFREADGGDLNGPFTRYLWNVVSDSAHRWSDLADQVAKPVLAELEKMPMSEKLRWRGERFTVKGQPYTMEAALAVALNWGNPSNRQKLVKGWRYGGLEKFGLQAWDGPETGQEFLRHLTAGDWKLVQRIWDQLETLWPQMEELEKRMTGLAPPKIKREKFTVRTPDGQDLELDGGYYPMVYDRRFSRAGAAQGEKSDLGSFQLFSPGAERAITPHGHLNARVEDFARPVDLSLVGLYRHMGHATKDVAMREALISVHEILTDSDFRAALQRTAGEEVLPLLDKWLRDTANDLVIPDGGEGQWLAFNNITRSGLTGSIFAFNAAQSLQNLTGVFNAADRVDARYLWKGISQVSKQRGAVIEWIKRVDPEMRHRARNLDRDLAAEFRRTLGRTGPVARAKQVAMWAFQASDAVTAYAVWLGAYHQALDGKVDGVGTTQQEAVRWASQTVRLSLTSNMTKDLPALMRSPHAKWFTMFAGWANSRLNRLIAGSSDARRDWSDKRRGRAIRKFTRITFWFLAAAVISDLAVGKGAQDDDEDGRVDGADWARFIARRAALAPFSVVPLVGPLARAVVDKRRDVSLAPVERIYSQAAQAIGTGIDAGRKWLAGDEEWTQDLADFALSGAEAAAMGTGLPVSQAKASLGYWLDPDRDPEDTALERALGTTYGKKRKGSLSTALTGE